MHAPTELAFPLIYTPLPGGFLPSTHAVAAPLDFFFGIRLSIFPFAGLFFLSCSEAGPSWIDSRKRGSEPLSCRRYCYSYSSCYWAGLRMLDGFGHQFPFSRALHFLSLSLPLISRPFIKAELLPSPSNIFSPLDLPPTATALSSRVRLSLESNVPILPATALQASRLLIPFRFTNNLFGEEDHHLVSL